MKRNMVLILKLTIALSTVGSSHWSYQVYHEHWK